MTVSSPYMTVREVATYLHLNEKKVYQLASDGHLPATKVTGKWLFPRKLVDQWLMESSHHGVLSDRLLISGSDDPLLQAALLRMMQEQQYQALYSYMPTGTQAGLSLLAQGLVDCCTLHWGKAEESHLRHPALIRQYTGARHWVLVHLFKRQQGLMLRKEDEQQPLAELLKKRWVVRQEGAGSQRFLKDWLGQQGAQLEGLDKTAMALTERETAAAIAQHRADLGPGTLAAATELGLGFLPVYEEAFELVVPRPVYFRTLLQQLFEWLQSEEGRRKAEQLEGYQLGQCGKLVWNGEDRKD
ncbi:DNA binding domain-containing protein, excisionase family [Marinospirillum celere]|uniref:DNA binding domain-containing protein, excisionase family n=1 Tax=Marinospirillum celere TaxID=1122252 RepID=A0A1I1JN48_9GAMM|nr:helix-turn-helix transcriptional regulator [Marinospirillum celere]SFC49805.1 DNA binding domain-containing protein, excisionase family [Marinospirillum celere]